MSQESHYKHSKLKSKKIPLRATHYQSFEMLAEGQPNSQKPPPSPFPPSLPSKHRHGRHSRTNSSSSVKSFDMLQPSTNFSFETSIPNISSDAWVNEIDPTTGNLFYVELQPVLRRKKHHDSSLSLSSAISDISISGASAPKSNATPGASPSISRKRKLKLSKLFPNRAFGRKKQTSTPNPVRISTFSLDEKINPKTSESSKSPSVIHASNRLITNSIKLQLEQPLAARSGEQITKDILTRLGILIQPASIRPARSVDDLLEGSSGKLANIPVIIKTLKPDSQACRDGRLKPGDTIRSLDKYIITHDNLFHTLDKIKHNTVISIDICREENESLKQEFDDVNPDIRKRESLVRLISRQETFESLATAHFSDNPKGLGTYLCMYITLREITSEGKKDGMEDLLFYYPHQPLPKDIDPSDSNASEIHKLVAIRGVFYTLADVLQSICGLAGDNATMKMPDGEIVCSVFKLLPNKEILILIAPESVISVEKLSDCLEMFLNILTFLFGNVSNAFIQQTNRQDLVQLCDLLYAHIFSVVLFDPFDIFISSLMACQSLCFHSEIETEVNSLVSELDAMDLSDQPEVSDMQRPYHIIGSCLYHKGYLICSHLPLSFQKDVNIFCSFHGLLNLTSTQPAGQIVIWREIFPTISEASIHKNQTQKNLNFKCLGGKHFLLVVGICQSICAQILLAGPMATRLLDKPPPDPLLIDRIKEMLEELERFGLFTDLEDRSLNAPHLPFITSPLATTDSSDNRNYFELGLRGSRGSLRTSGDSTDSEGSNLTKTQSRHSLNLLDNLDKPHSSGKAATFDSIAFLTSSPTNLLFHYLVFDDFSGIFLSPPAFLKTPNLSQSVQKDLVLIFHTYCLHIQEKFKRSKRYSKNFAKLNKRFKTSKSDDPEQSTGELNECGFKFEWEIAGKSTKDQSTVIFWVIGRRIFRPKPCELYICYEDATPQSTVEMAFKLLQSNII